LQLAGKINFCQIYKFFVFFVWDRQGQPVVELTLQESNALRFRPTVLDLRVEGQLERIFISILLHLFYFLFVLIFLLHLFDLGDDECPVALLGELPKHILGMLFL